MEQMIIDFYEEWTQTVTAQRRAIWNEAVRQKRQGSSERPICISLKDYHELQEKFGFKELDLNSAEAHWSGENIFFDYLSVNGNITELD